MATEKQNTISYNKRGTMQGGWTKSSKRCIFRDGSAVKTCGNPGSQ